MVSLKNKKNRIFILFYFLLIDFITFAQVPPGPGDEDGDGDLEGSDPEAVNLDKMLLLLFIVGIIYAFYFIKNKNALIKN